MVTIGYVKVVEVFNQTLNPYEKNKSTRPT